MKQSFSTSWISSTQPRKQKKYIANAPLHLKRKYLSAPLSKELKKKYSRRSIRLRTGDKVRILRGQFKKKEGKIVEVIVKKTKVNIENIQSIKKDGSKAPFPMHPSNLMILELQADDRMRKKYLERTNDTSKKTKSS